METLVRIFGGLTFGGLLFALLGASLNLSAEGTRQASLHDVFGFGKMGPAVWRTGVVVAGIGIIGLLICGAILLAGA